MTLPFIDGESWSEVAKQSIPELTRGQFFKWKRKGFRICPFLEEANLKLFMFLLLPASTLPCASLKEGAWHKQREFHSSTI